MKISLDWLREFVDIAASPRELKTALTGVGLGVESFTELGDVTVLEVEVTTNRPDCLSHHGVARELAVLYGKPLKPLAASVNESAEPVTGAVTIEIAEPSLCSRYCGRVIRNVQVKPSPPWLARRLESLGVRSINNVADVTNYVLMELGHPLHAFDLARLRQQKIIVRRASTGEKLRTLDGIDRALTPENLVIADGERAVALAGVMGGEESEISAATRAVMLESAWFEPLSIRRTAKAHGLHTEASHRFERGADIAMAPVALDRAAQLIAELAGGEVLSGIVDVYPEPQRRESITLRENEIERILGTKLSGGDVVRILQALGFKISETWVGVWAVRPPTFRLDVTREVDLIEEVARLYGYDRLPSRLRPAPPRVERDARREKELAISRTLVSFGYREIIASSMVDRAENASFTTRPPVILSNPLSQEASVMRSTSVLGMLHALRWNLDRDQNDLRLFEIGKTYAATVDPNSRLPEERQVLTLGLAAHRRVAGPHDSERAADFFDLKGDLETLLDIFDVPGLHFESGAEGYYEKGWGGRFLRGQTALVSMGRLGREVLREYKLRHDVYVAEIDLEHLMTTPLRPRSFHGYSKFPAVTRDFSLLVPTELSYARLKRTLQGLDLAELRGYGVADRFRGGSLPPGTYSLLLRVTLQSNVRTLTSTEVERIGEQILTVLEPLGVKLRTAVASGR